MKILTCVLLATLAMPRPAAGQSDTATVVAIWSRVIDAAYPNRPHVIIADSSLDLARAPRAASSWLARSALSDTVALFDMLSANRTAVPLSRAFRDRVVGGAMRDTTHAPRFVSLALPGFNATRDVAFVYGQFTCGRRCDWDEGFVLEYRGDRWTVVARRRYGIS